MYSHERWSAMIEEKFDAIRNLAALKGGEYSGDEDRLDNFRRNGVDLGLPMETIWRVYAAKHWDAIGQYVKDLHSNKERSRLEPIAGRVDDLLVYLLLFAAMIEEREGASRPFDPPIIPKFDLEKAIARIPKTPGTSGSQRRLRKRRED